MIRAAEILIAWLAGLLLLLLLLITFADVIARNALNRPIAGATELSEIALVGVTFMLYPLAAWQKRHIVVDLLDNMMPPLVRRLQAAAAGLLGALLFAVLAWRLDLRGDRLATFGDVTPYLKLPLAPVYYFMAILSALTALAFLVTAVRAFFEPIDQVGGSSVEEER